MTVPNIIMSKLREKIERFDRQMGNIIMAEPLIQRIVALGYIVYQLGFKDEEQRSKANYNWRYWIIPSENYRLRGKPFYYDKENDFIHFTSLESAYSIINTGFFRLYNLINMNDKMEFEYGQKELQFPHSLETDKENIYCLSMCSFKDITSNETKEHLLWKLYGKDGYGVIVRISFENNLEFWYNYHLTKVFYDLQNATLIRELQKKTNKEIFDTKLLCFFKHPIYEFESEIRLVFDNRINFRVTQTDKHKNLIYTKTYPDKLHKTKNISYFQLPIYNFNKNSSDIYLAPNVQGLEYEIPKIKINEIILGYRYTNRDLKNIQKKLNSKHTNFNIKITSLKKYF